MKKTFGLIMISIVLLTAWSGRLLYDRAHGTRLTVPVEGFDPRSLISGRYIRLQIKYEADLSCGNKRNFDVSEAYICWDTKKITKKMPEDCPVFIRGQCRWGRFRDNVSRYYLPEDAAPVIDRDLRKRISEDDGENIYELRLSVTKTGAAYPEELLINGEPWGEWFKLYQ